ncbi:hypothetical protein [Paenibacillus sp. FSL H7-0714]|uniref:hypothetical protein n=1 Tax=Paenibacillus sp. FSL H7-0714 TaxID=2954735 RepID=UPI0030FBB667
MFEKLKNILMIIIILLCFGLLFLVGAKAIEAFKLDWDALAFVGSIIGGVIGGFVHYQVLN